MIKVYRKISKLRLKSKNPEKYTAGFAVMHALKTGKLKRLPCEICGKKAQAHHPDYKRHLEVKWLCFKHHRQEHGQMLDT
ncbi:MAG: hypothetical protein KGL39_33930 [Patescibacteria group bacterium]|nr:hypothetical protein [Patescibacteria group bacterium]